MPVDPLKLVVLMGSVREGRFCPTVTDWFADLAKQHSAFTVEVVDLAGVELPHVLPALSPADPAMTRPEGMRRLTERLTEADAFVVVTPEYNHSYPTVLKAAVDWHFDQWQAKPVGFVSYGGQGAGLRAVEALRLVFAELHAVTLRDGVAFPWAHAAFGTDGRPLDAEGAAEAAATLLDQLAWWGAALSEARAKQAYPLAA